MANRTYTLTITDFDMNSSTSVSGADSGSASAGTVVVDIAESAKKSEVVQALNSLVDLISSDQVVLN